MYRLFRQCGFPEALKSPLKKRKRHSQRDASYADIF
jgi:hypothetical protein